MRIPKRVNTVLDWAEQHFGALAAVAALVIAALAATLAPPLAGLPVAGFILGLAAGGFLVHLRMAKRVTRARSEIDDLLRENGALRHRNTVLASGVITREAQVTQALLAIPEDVLLGEEDPQRTVALPDLGDLPGLPEAAESPKPPKPPKIPKPTEAPDGAAGDAPEQAASERTAPQQTAPEKAEEPEELEDTKRNRKRR
ncbi:hypothetical protein [Actinomadura xylanilytica]|uniref:hypothetical protein n=1 Tax=Actinomadura xylanilytica TaxID=887459 RepID=UPI00255AC9FE|nr:hypothetical protein [Actinomadura xylanilytica]MDL4775520.1 hypothetical protein [Actinomadura xylanilytica]